MSAMSSNAPHGGIPAYMKESSGRSRLGSSSPRLEVDSIESMEAQLRVGQLETPQTTPNIGFMDRKFSDNWGVFGTSPLHGALHGSSQSHSLNRLGSRSTLADSETASRSGARSLKAHFRAKVIAAWKVVHLCKAFSYWRYRALQESCSRQADAYNNCESELNDVRLALTRETISNASLRSELVDERKGERKLISMGGSSGQGSYFMELGKLQTENTRLQEELAEARAEIELRRKEYRALEQNHEKEVTALENELHNAIRKADERYESVNTDKEALEIQLERLKGYLKHVEAEVDVEKEEARDFLMKEVEARLDEVNGEKERSIQSILREKEEMEKYLMTQQVREERALAQIKHENTQITKQMYDIADQLGVVTAEKTGLESELKSVMDELDKSESYRLVLGKKVQEAENKLQLFQRDRIAESENSAAELEELSTKVAGLSLELDSTRQELSKAKIDAEDAQNAMNRMKQQLGSVDDRIRQAEEEHESEREILIQSLAELDIQLSIAHGKKEGKGSVKQAADAVRKDMAYIKDELLRKVGDLKEENDQLRKNMEFYSKTSTEERDMLLSENSSLREAVAEISNQVEDLIEERRQITESLVELEKQLQTLQGDVEIDIRTMQNGINTLVLTTEDLASATTSIEQEYRDKFEIANRERLAVEDDLRQALKVYKKRLGCDMLNGKYNHLLDRKGSKSPRRQQPANGKSNGHTSSHEGGSCLLHPHGHHHDHTCDAHQHPPSPMA